MKTVDVLVFDCGECRSPASLVEAMKTMPMRTVTIETEDGDLVARTEADPKTPEGAKFWAWFKEQNAAQAKAYFEGKPFEPSEYV